MVLCTFRQYNIISHTVSYCTDPANQACYRQRLAAALQEYRSHQCWSTGLEIQTSTQSCNFSTEQMIASFPYWGPSLVCSPSMLLFRQRTAAFQPSAPHTSFPFLSPCPPSCFPSLRIKVTRSGWMDPLGSSSIHFYKGKHDRCWSSRWS